MFKIIKTNKKPVTHTFNTLTELQDYIDKNYYTKGRYTLFVNDQPVLIDVYAFDVKPYLRGL